MRELSEFIDFGNKVSSSRMRVERTDNQVANQFFKERHYLKRVRRSKKVCYAVFLDGVTVGFLEFSYPIWHHRRGIIPPYKQGEVVELSRVCLLDSAPKNSESCAISKALKELIKDWKLLTSITPKLVVSYSDKSGQGHSGGIYKAVGFKLIGVSHRKIPRHGSAHHQNPYSTNDGKLLFAKNIQEG